MQDFIPPMKIQFIASRVEEELIRKTAAMQIFRAAMYNFLDDYMPVRMAGKVRKLYYPLEIAAVTM